MHARGSDYALVNARAIASIFPEDSFSTLSFAMINDLRNEYTRNENTVTFFFSNPIEDFTKIGKIMIALL